MSRDRITDKQLQYLVDQINIATKSPIKPHEKVGAGFKANIGNYHISGAYGGVALEQMVNDSGGVRSMFGGGYRPKRELYEKMRAFLDGISAKC